jgi:hypothetical protein
MIVVGFDEAGYGPTLGPLVVGYSAFRIEGALADPPCLWKALETAVRSGARGEASKVWVADSKAIKPRKDGLKHLELGVLAFADFRESMTLEDLLSALGVGDHVAKQAWFGDLAATKIPAKAWPGEVASRADRIAEASQASGVHFLDAAVRVYDARTYNDRVEETRNKGAVLEEACVSLVRSLRQRHTGDLHLTFDKHGGRNRYLRLLGRAFPMCALEIEHEGAEESSYTTVTPQGAVRALFRRSAEDESLPVALASMHCKYLREQLMARFNAWFGERIPGVKPTAGYALDAKRFLADVEQDLPRLGVARRALVRSR